MYDEPPPLMVEDAEEALLGVVATLLLVLLVLGINPRRRAPWVSVNLPPLAGGSAMGATSTFK